MDFKEIDFNDEFVAAFDALEHSGRHLFITGKAGTGKSTLLQYFRHRTERNIAVLAPTGVSAIHIKGQTIHSFFQFKPDITPQTVGDIPIRKRKRQLYQKLEAIVIDEVSMVRADLMDCIDTMLRLYGPHHDRPFGGVQMIFFGDLFQLPPVVSREEEDIFRTVYPTPFFFSAKAFETIELQTMELKKIYRQKDEQFIHMLNAVRDNALGAHHISAFNTRFDPQHQIPAGEFYITLTTTNALAEKVNVGKLNELPGRSHKYQGVVAGEFDRKSLPTAEYLEIKKGAQIMMLNNDPDKRWVNGSLGVVRAVRAGDEGDDVIIVDLENGQTVDVQKYPWEIYQYYFDEAIETLSSKVIGYFTQYPLKLAWAVTIHKSQGQTFEKVIIDVGFGTFAHGQMYVALSRCTSLKGVILKKPLSARHVLLDERVVDFHKRLLALTAVVFLGLTSLLYADEREQAVAKALTKVQEQKAMAETWEGKNSDQPYLVLLNEYETKVNPDWSYEETYHTRIRIQKESAKQLGQWPVYYNKARDQIVDIKAFVETPEGKKFDATNIQDMEMYDNSPMYSDMRAKVVTMPQVNIGSMLDVAVHSKTSRKEIPRQFWDDIPYPLVPTKFSRYTYIFPQDKKIEFKAYKTGDKPLVENKDGMVKYSFVFEETGDMQDEDLMPPADEARGSRYLSSIKDWKVIADWARELVNKNMVDDPAIAAKTAELTKDKASQKDKARAILEFLQDNFRYVAMNFGNNTVEPHPTNDIFKDRYGDCKDLGVLAKQMLKLAGIPSNYCLMNSEFSGNPQNAAPNPTVFEHVVLEASLDGQKYFVDPQTKGFDFGQYPSGYDNAYVMVIDDAGYRFDHLPVSKEEDDALISQSDITLAPDGSAVFDARVQLPLEASQSFRGQWASTTDGDKNKFFESLEANYAQGGTMLSHEVKGVENRYGPVEFHLKYKSPNAYPVVNDMLLLKEADQSNIPDFAARERKYPVFVPGNSLIKNTNVYHVPGGYKLDFLPPAYKLSFDFVDISMDYAAAGDAVTVNALYRIKRALVPPQRYPELKAFRNEVYKKNDQYIILKQKSQASPQAKDWIKNQ